MLDVRCISTFYGHEQVLFDVSLTIEKGECIVLAGGSGAGKTTVMKSIVGLVRPASGDIVFAGNRMTCEPIFRIARQSISIVLGEYKGFRSLTVDENLSIAMRVPSERGKWHCVESIYELFPLLREKRHVLESMLSGGERQMLAIGQALLSNPRLLLLDDAAEGLSPQARGILWDVVKRIRSQGLSVLLADRHAPVSLADRCYTLEAGRVISGSGAGVAAFRAASPSVP